ncbi:MAG: erfK [Chthoniobacteraceae bacterium]|nr:erfK [Chthoniobacteraceae bacterium]MDB6174781.1 erfK [Chthoniobacteraceae bacterium]
MKRFLLLALGAALLSSCASTPISRPYSVTAYKPHNPNNVRVKVSTSTQNVYVLEGDRLLMAVQSCVGAHGTTPMGTFRINTKIKDKRSYSYGFTSNGQPAEAAKGQNVAKGYPMAYWCEFKPAYGFHEGFVWSEPRTHGCIRMHKQAASRFFALVHEGTPVNIATTQPEDATFGRSVRRLDQRNDPNPPTPLLMSQNWFQDPAGPLLIEQ